MKIITVLPAALILSLASFEANAAVVKTFSGNTSRYCSSSEAYDQYRDTLDGIEGRVANGDYGATSYTESSELILGESNASSYSSCEKVLDENGAFDFYRTYFVDWQIDMHNSLPTDETAYAHVYTDEECASIYEGSYSMSFPADAADIDSVDLGSCKLEQTSLDGDGKGIGVCTFSEDGATQSCFSDWTATSTGVVNELSLGDDLVIGSDMGEAEKSDDVPDYLTQTDDVSSCGGSSVSLGGASYCVNTTNVEVTDLGGSAWSAGGGSGSGDGDGDGDGTGDGEGDGEGDGDGTGTGTGDGDGDGSCTEGQTCTTVNIPSGYETEVTVETVMASFQTQLEEAPIMNMMPNLPSGSTASCAPISFSIGWIVNGSFELDYCSWLINSGVLGLITSISMFGFCLAAFRIVMGA
ncbi:hypothetical protein [Terasakiella pusilla]|uniref:hypothetical protein n=1 Tax=Terasakiella pusilla TaxID=64973 RepID=UPI003AA8B121